VFFLVLLLFRKSHLLDYPYQHYRHKSLWILCSSEEDSKFFFAFNALNPPSMIFASNLSLKLFVIFDDYRCFLVVFSLRDCENFIEVFWG